MGLWRVVPSKEPFTSPRRQPKSIAKPRRISVASVKASRARFCYKPPRERKLVRLIGFSVLSLRKNLVNPLRPQLDVGKIASIWMYATGVLRSNVLTQSYMYMRGISHLTRINNWKKTYEVFTCGHIGLRRIPIQGLLVVILFLRIGHPSLGGHSTDAHRRHFGKSTGSRRPPHAATALEFC
jgi:hypothetical protein